jgi:hypothetical protein
MQPVEAHICRPAPMRGDVGRPDTAAAVLTALLPTEYCSGQDGLD